MIGDCLGDMDTARLADIAQELMLDVEFGLRLFGVVAGSAGGGGDTPADRRAFDLVHEYLLKRGLAAAVAVPLAAVYVGGIAAGTHGMERIIKDAQRRYFG